jgi:hypothetical protein
MEGSVVIRPAVDVFCLLYKPDLFRDRIKRFQINRKLVIGCRPTALKNRERSKIRRELRLAQHHRRLIYPEINPPTLSCPSTSKTISNKHLKLAEFQPPLCGYFLTAR